MPPETQNVVQDFITLKALATYGGATTAVFILNNTVYRLGGPRSVWVPFIVAQLVAFIGAGSAGAITSLGAAFIVLLNGCLLFCSALGANEAMSSTDRPPGQVKLHAGEKRKWLSSWFGR